jgi:hypothetical protein
MTESEHTTTKLARALEAIPGVPADMIKRATDGYYHDFLSPLDFPEITLVKDLRELAKLPATPRASRPLLRELAQAVINGDYDASTEESRAWMASPEGQETLAELARPKTTAPPGVGDQEAVQACADLAGRTGAKSFECGYVHDGVPPAEAGWYASAKFKGARVVAEDKSSPAEACDELAVRLLSGAQCQHCRKLVTLSAAGTMAHDVTLMNGRTWTAQEQAAAGLCHWRRAGDRWKRGCE